MKSERLQAQRQKDRAQCLHGRNSLLSIILRKRRVNFTLRQCTDEDLELCCCKIKRCYIFLKYQYTNVRI